MPKSRTIALARQSDAVALFREGKTFDQIAEAVGYANRGTAHRAVTTAFRERVVNDVDMHRQLEMDRLDAMQAALYPLAEDGNLDAVRVIVRIIGERCRLLGLYDSPPARQLVTREGNTGKATPDLRLVPKQEKAA